MCGQYREGLLLGDACADLCDQEALVPDQCQAMHFGKEVVFTAKWRDKEVSGQFGKLGYLMEILGFNKSSKKSNITTTFRSFLPSFPHESNKKPEILLNSIFDSIKFPDSCSRCS